MSKTHGPVSFFIKYQAIRQNNRMKINVRVICKTFLTDGAFSLIDPSIANL